MTRHELKCARPYFEQVVSGLKTFEIRIDDRGYKIGDVLWLREWSVGEYTGQECAVKVTYVTTFRDGLRAGYVCMAIVPHKEEL